MEITIWQQLEYTPAWQATQTYYLDLLAPSWFEIRSRFQSIGEAESQFLLKHKRKHALETGIVEKLYDIERGVTETLINHGFDQAILSHNDATIPNNQLIEFLNNQLSAVDLVFDYVKEERNLSKNMINQVHALLVKNQQTYTAYTSNKDQVTLPLKGGEYKKNSNNPSRIDGTVFLYCPPILVESELDKMLAIYNELEVRITAGEENVARVAAWVHHAFTTIHPFPDGNGRVARLLASFIFIKHGFLPFTIIRDDKPVYIDALELADKGDPSALVEFFCLTQRRTIEEALSAAPELEKATLVESGSRLRQIFQKTRERQAVVRREEITKWALSLETIIVSAIHDNVDALKVSGLDVSLDWASILDKDKSHYYNFQIVGIARKHGYFYNAEHGKSWFKVRIKYSDTRNFDIIFSLHHFGYTDSAVSLGAFLDDRKQQENSSIILPQAPVKISLEALGKADAAMHNAIAKFAEESIKQAINEIENIFDSPS